MSILDELKDIEMKQVKQGTVRMFKDFSKCEILQDYDLGGVIPKIVVLDGRKKKILKFAKVKEALEVRDYLTEFIACRVAKSLGYDVQEVELGYFNGKECVAIEMFDYDIVTFTGFGQSTDSMFFHYDLDMLLTLPFDKKKFNLSQSEFERFVWHVFVLDMFISNFDRHENNWGFQRVNGKYTPTALYDLGASLYNRFILNGVDYNLKEIRHIIESDTRCAILYQGKKKNYTELMILYGSNQTLLSE